MAILNRLKVLREEVSASNVGTVSDLGTPPKAGVPTRRITDSEVLRRGTTVCPECGGELKDGKCTKCDFVMEYVVGTKTDLGVRPSSPPPKKILMGPKVHIEPEVQNCPSCGGRLANDYCVKCREFTSDLASIDVEDTIYDPEEGGI
jgi:uncharacterized protein with PIN domain